MLTVSVPNPANLSGSVRTTHDDALFFFHQLPDNYPVQVASPLQEDRSMPTTSALTRAIEQSHAALGAILTGDPSVYQALYSPADDVTLGNLLEAIEGDSRAKV
jgi:hypothetical protein